jgi:hypothetical protein
MPLKNFWWQYQFEMGKAAMANIYCVILIFYVWALQKWSANKVKLNFPLKPSVFRYSSCQFSTFLWKPFCVWFSKFSQQESLYILLKIWRVGLPAWKDFFQQKSFYLLSIALKSIFFVKIIRRKSLLWHFVEL